MSLDSKLSSINGRLPAKFKMKRAKESFRWPTRVRKWIRSVLLFWFFGAVSVGSVLLSLSFAFNGVCEDGKFKIQTFSCPETLTVSKYFNVSQNLLLGLASDFSESDQVVTLECSKGPITGTMANYGISCSVKILRSEESGSRKQLNMVAKNGKMTNECPFGQEESIVWGRYFSLLKHEYVFYVVKYVISATSHIFQENPFQSGQYRLFRDLIKEHWWVLVIVALSFKVASDTWHQMLLCEQPQKPPLLSLGPPKGAGKWMKVLLVLFYVAGVMVSIWLFWHFSTKDTSMREETLVNMCDERARMLQDQFNVSMNHVHALALLVSTFHHGKKPSAIDQKTFGEYAERTAFERPLTSGVAYALKVVHSEREQFEKEHGWTIKKMEDEDQTLVQDCVPENLDPAPVKDEYAPVIFSQETVSHIVSIDMMSGKEDRENILRARATGKGVLTSPFKLLKSNHLGVVLTFAVYNKDMPSSATPEQRVEATMGYLGASYDVPSLVEKLLHQLASKETIVVNVYDTTNASHPINMYGDDVIDTGFLRVSPLDFGDPLRSHEMHCRFKQQPPLPWTAINASGVVLLITFLVGHIFHAAIIRIAKVEADYRMMVELKARAEAADVAKSQFLATVSHEIRTPMNGVLGMLQMLMDTELDATQQDFAYTAHASGKDLISLINEVLDQAKIESGRLELEDVPFDLRAVLDNVLSLFSGKSNEKGIELAVYVSSRVPEVVIGDPGRFRQIITNLVGNSIKFTNDRGHIFVTVHLAEEVKSASDTTDDTLKQRLGFVKSNSNQTPDTLSGYPVVERWKSWEQFKNLVNTTSEESDSVKLLVTVEDTGVGIPIEAQDRIFTPFVQADSSTSRTYGGTGIGLSISKCLVELMGGEIGFVSKPGTGSTFAFTGCLRKGEVISLDPKWQQCDPNTLEFRGLKSLVVDKSIVRAEVSRYHLERLGISVDIASDMESACSNLSSASNHGSLTSLAMVLIDKDVWDRKTCRTFQQLLQRQRQNGSTETSTNTPKIFLLTTSISPSERNALKSAGLVDNILVKPLRLSVLNACFLEALVSGKKSTVNRKKLPTLGTLLREKRILVVDDNIVNRRVAEGALKKYGALVTCVESGKAALKKLEPPHDFDACFMDLQMPEMDGFEATRRIRSKESEVNDRIASGEALPEMYRNVCHWHTPILAMTADVIQASNEQCIKCGMDDYVSKPFDEGQLYSAVARFFKS